MTSNITSSDITRQITIVVVHLVRRITLILGVWMREVTIHVLGVITLGIVVVVFGSFIIRSLLQSNSCLLELLLVPPFHAVLKVLSVIKHMSHVLYLFVVAVGGRRVGGVIIAGRGQTVIYVRAEGGGGGATVTRGIPVGGPCPEDLTTVARVRVATGVLFVVGIGIIGHSLRAVSTGVDRWGSI